MPKNPVVNGATQAVLDPEQTHIGGVIYTMPDGSQVDVYNTGGEQFSFRTLNPGIKSYSGEGVIGHYPKTIGGHVYQYPIFASVGNAKKAALDTLGEINRRNIGTLALKNVFEWGLEEGSRYYNKYIQNNV